MEPILLFSVGVFGLTVILMSAALADALPPARPHVRSGVSSRAATALDIRGYIYTHRETKNHLVLVSTRRESGRGHLRFYPFHFDL